MCEMHGIVCLASLSTIIPTLPSFGWLILLFLTAINIVGASLMLIDKRRSIMGRWRIRERTFFLLALLGGGIGEIAAMFLVRHKTKHLSFVIGIPVITAILYGSLLFSLIYL